MFTKLGIGYRFTLKGIILEWNHNPLNITAAPYKLRLKYRTSK